MLNILANVAKSVVAVAATPVMVVADVLTLPSTALDGKSAFGRTARTLGTAGDCLAAAIKPTVERE